jgi:hypothetical protein
MTLAAQALDGVAIGQNCSPGTHQGQHAPLIPIASAATSVPYAERGLSNCHHEPVPIVGRDRATVVLMLVNSVPPGMGMRSPRSFRGLRT